MREFLVVNIRNQRPLMKEGGARVFRVRSEAAKAANTRNARSKGAFYRVMPFEVEQS